MLLIHQTNSVILISKIHYKTKNTNTNSLKILNKFLHTDLPNTVIYITLYGKRSAKERTVVPKQ